jgi:hypothetical protein
LGFQRCPDRKATVAATRGISISLYQSQQMDGNLEMSVRSVVHWFGVSKCTDTTRA